MAISQQDLLSYYECDANGKAKSVPVKTVLSTTDIKYFHNSGNEQIHLFAPAGNASTVIITLQARKSADDGDIVNRTVTLAAGEEAVVSNLNILFAGIEVALSTDLSGADSIEAIQVVPSFL